MEPEVPTGQVPPNAPPSDYQGVWPPPPAAPIGSYGAVPPNQGFAFPFKTEFRYVRGSVPLFRTGTLWLSQYGLAIRGKAAPRYEIQVPILIASIVLGAGWLIAYLIMEYAVRTDAALDLTWDRVRQVVLSPKRRRVCLVYDAPDYKGVVKPYSLTTNLPGPQYDAFVETIRPFVSDRMSEGKLRNWTSPVVWVVCAGILLGIAFYAVLFAVGSLARHSPQGEPVPLALREDNAVQRLGIMGGTFDPIHYGHLLMAEEARQAFALDQVVFVPNGRPAHKKAYLVSFPEDRYAMTLLATASNPLFRCSRIEIERPGVSYTIDTLRAFRALYPGLDSLYFITGADAILEILTWHEYQRLVEECRFIAVTRPGFALDTIREVVSAEFLDRISFLPIPGLDISSTDIRRRVREGRSVKYLTPGAVEAYVSKNGLYRPTGQNDE